MENDNATGMSHTLWRQYDNLSARWTAPDPYGGSMSIAAPQSFNRYSYVENDPVNQVDPLGLMLSDIGVSQTNDPAEARRMEQQSLRDHQIAINAQYAARHGGTVSYAGNRAAFMSPAASAAAGVSAGFQSQSTSAPTASETARARWNTDLLQSAIRMFNPFSATPEGEVVPGSETPNNQGRLVYNCMAWGLGRTDMWIQAGDQGRRGNIVELNLSRFPVTGNLIREGNYSNRELPAVYGGTLLRQSETCSAGTYQLRVFEDSGNTRNWHVMRQDSPLTWSSKNGNSFRYVNISDPNAFYRSNYPPRVNVVITNYCMPLTPRRP